jgi:hypothetical protein
VKDQLYSQRVKMQDELKAWITTAISDRTKDHVTAHLARDGLYAQLQMALM